MTTLNVEMPEKLIPLFIDENGAEIFSRTAAGGRDGGKTFTFGKMSAIKGYQLAEQGETGIILCFREYMNSLEDSSMSVIKYVIDEDPFLRSYYNVGKNYIETKNGKIRYVFSGLQKINSIKSKFKILLAWGDEAQDVSEHAWQILLPTLREENSELWITYNPKNKTDPTDIRFRQNIDEDAKFVEINYYDNPYHSKIAEKQRLRDLKNLPPETYAWIWEGAYLEKSDAQIFAGCYEIAEFKPTNDWSGAYFGLDFGFAQDPTACVEVYVFSDCLYIYNESVRKGLELDKTAEFIVSRMPKAKDYVIRADNSRPESISYLRRNGLPKITACVKGKGSVEDGIEFMKSFAKIVIHPRCKETINEFNSYSYKVDKLTGDVQPVIIDAYNHCIDAIRYAIEPMIKVKGKVKQSPLWL